MGDLLEQKSPSSTISIKAERRKRGLNREALAFLSTVSLSTIVAAEARGVLSRKTRVLVARVFGCSPEELAP